LLVNAQGHEPDFDASDATVLVQLAEAAELLQRIFQLGISATGQLLAHASVQVETGEVDPRHGRSSRMAAGRTRRCGRRVRRTGGTVPAGQRQTSPERRHG
jgi:hypothetical protein